MTKAQRAPRPSFPCLSFPFVRPVSLQLTRPNHHIRGMARQSKQTASLVHDLLLGGDRRIQAIQNQQRDKTGPSHMMFRERLSRCRSMAQRNRRTQILPLTFGEHTYKAKAVHMVYGTFCPYVAAKNKAFALSPKQTRTILYANPYHIIC